MTRKTHHGGKIWVHIFLDKPVTVRTTETFMGLGKGSFEYWTHLNIADNSGARELMCIQIIRVSNH
ncbi:hypothetical protein ACSBR1_014777 [Camellia fascicularis]